MVSTGFSERFWEYVQNTIEKKVIEEFDANRGLEAIPTTEDIDAKGTSLFKHETLRDIICNYLSPRVRSRDSIDEEELKFYRGCECLDFARRGTKNRVL